MNLFKRSRLSVMASAIIIVGCGGNPSNPDKLDIPNGSPSPPVTEAVKTNIPEALGLNKGGAEKVVDKSVDMYEGSFDVNQKIQLRTLLTGYYNFESYVFDAQIKRDGGVVDRLYATSGYYDANLNRFVIKGSDFVVAPKKV